MTLKQERVLRTAIDCAKVVYGVNPMFLSRVRRNVWARMAAYIELRKMEMTHDEIGGCFGKDHATVLHATRKHFDFIKNDQEYREQYNRFADLMESRMNVKMTTIDDLKDRVIRINNELLAMDYDWYQIKKFWKESLREAKLMNKSA